MKKLLVTPILIVALGCMFHLPEAYAASDRQVDATDVKGEAFYIKPGSTDWLPLLKGTTLTMHDKVKIGSESKARLMFQGQADAWVEVREDSELTLRHVGSEDSGDDTELFLLIGSVLVKAEKLKGKSKFEVHTPNSIVGIRGTEFEVNVD
jgi:hypothetical protein